MVFSKVHEFVKNIVFSPRWARFVIFALGVPLFSEFQQSTRVFTKRRFRRELGTFCHFRTGHNTFYLFWAKCASLYKTVLSARDQHVLPFSHWVHYFLPIFSKVHEFVQNSVSCASSALLHFAQHSLAVLSKVREFVQNRVFSPRSARFVDSAVGAILFAIFRKVHKLVKNWVYSSTPARFLIFALGAPLSWRF